MTEKRKISRDEYLRALALFVCANDHYMRSRQFEAELAKLVGDPGESHYCGFISDALYIDDKVSASDFDTALKQSSIEVEDASQA